MDNSCFEDTSDGKAIVRERANCHRYRSYFLRLYKRNPKAQRMISEILAENGEETSWDDVL